MNSTDLFPLETPIQEIHFEPISTKGNRLFMKRDDLIHPFVSGNKWRKLKYNVEEADRQEKKVIATFGGAYSNHLIATAAAAASLGLESIGYVRGEELGPISNVILRLCHEFGMELKFISRSEYNNKEEIASKLQGDDVYIVPEGGANEFGIMGCADILSDVEGFEHIVLAVGTGTTMRGLIRKTGFVAKVHGIAALQGADYLRETIGCESGNWQLHTDYSFGGFGKFDAEQMEFNRSFTKATGILLDPIYTGKMMRGLADLVKTNQITESRILCIHTGGLTGILSDKWLKC